MTTVVCPTCSDDICTHVVARALNADNALESALARAEQAEAREAVLRKALEALKWRSHDGQGCFDPAAKCGDEWVRWRPCEREHNDRCQKARAALAATATSAGEG